MAKRFIDTDFFKDPFVRGLQGAYKGLYIYLFLDCSNAGIWNVELDVAKLRCGIPDSVSDEQIKDVFSDKIIEVDNGNKWFIKNFIKVQHNGLLKANNKAHISAINELLKFDLIKEIKDGEYILNQGASKGHTSLYGNGKGNSIGKSNGNGLGNGKSEKKSKVDFEKIIEIFNAVCHNSPEVKKITNQRKSAINARVKDYGLEEIGKVFNLVSSSDFLNGNNDRGWKADFDWIMNPNNFIKILEGKYINNGNRNSHHEKSDSQIKSAVNDAVDRMLG